MDAKTEEKTAQGQEVKELGPEINNPFLKIENGEIKLEKQKSEKSFPNKALAAKAWTKGGPSPNPGGRPRSLRSIVLERTNNGLEIIETWIDLMRNSHSQKIRIQAADSLADRAWGKPVQSIEGKIEGPDIGEMVLSQIGAFWTKIAGSIRMRQTAVSVEPSPNSSQNDKAA